MSRAATPDDNSHDNTEASISLTTDSKHSLFRSNPHLNPYLNSHSALHTNPHTTNHTTTHTNTHTTTHTNTHTTTHTNALQPHNLAQQGHRHLLQTPPRQGSRDKDEASSTASTSSSSGSSSNAGKELKFGVPIFRNEDGLRRLYLTLHIGNEFQPADVMVQVRGLTFSGFFLSRFHAVKLFFVFLFFSFNIFTFDFV